MDALTALDMIVVLAIFVVGIIALLFVGTLLLGLLQAASRPRPRPPVRDEHQPPVVIVLPVQEREPFDQEKVQ